MGPFMALPPRQRRQRHEPRLRIPLQPQSPGIYLELCTSPLRMELVGGKERFDRARQVSKNEMLRFGCGFSHSRSGLVHPANPQSPKIREPCSEGPVCEGLNPAN